MEKDHISQLESESNSRTGFKLVPNPLHDKSFLAMEDYRKRNPTFVYWLREKNTNNRLNEGFWFQGTEKYAHVALYSAESGNISTKSIGLVFWPNGGDRIGFTLEVIHRDEKNRQLLNFYSWLKNLLAKDFKDALEDNGTYGFKIFMEGVDPFKLATDFLDKYKLKFDSKIKELELDNIFISQSSFEKKLSNTKKRRDAIITNNLSGQSEFQDNIIDIEELSEENKLGLIVSNYRHISASEMKPVIGVVDLAIELAQFLKNLRGDAPMLIGLFGKWGRGKTFLFNQIWKILSQEKHFFRVDFHAWKHQQTPASWGYLYEAIAQEYYNQSSGWFGKPLRSLKLNFKRSNNWDLLLFIVILIIGSLLYFFTEIIDNNISGAIGIFGGTALLTLFLKVLKFWEKRSTRAMELYKKYTHKQSYSNLLGIQAEVQSELRTLLLTWIKEKPEWEIKWRLMWKWPFLKRDKERTVDRMDKRILLFVDDIDRCSEDRIIEVVDALRVMLEDPEIAKRIVAVVAVDERILRRAIRIKYKILLTEEGKNNSAELNNLTREYLDKLFLSGIKLAPLNTEERKVIFGALTEGKVETAIEPKKENGGVDKPITDLKQEPTLELANDINDSSYNDDNSDNEDPNLEYEITLEEEKVLSLTISKLREITPRQIRIFYLRYLLGREFLKNIKKQISWEDREVKALVSVMAFIYNQDIIDRSVAEILKEAKDEEPSLEAWFALERDQRTIFTEVLAMVVTY